MSTHYHLVLRVDEALANSWSDEEIVRRWKLLYNDTSRPFQEYRERLYGLSWFMRCLNESLAKQANQEDGCKGRFWEGRFKSQALLDPTALLACMA